MDIANLQQTYQEWATQRIKFVQLDTSILVETPFVDMHHDTIELFIENTTSGYRMTDDGYTLDELDTLGIQINRSEKRLGYFTKILMNFGVSHDPISGELFIPFDNLNDFPVMQNRLIQCVIQVSDLLLTSRSNVMNLFTEELADFFLDNDIPIDQGVGYRGKTGNEIIFDITVGKTRHTAPKAIKAVNNPTSSAYESPLLNIIDVQPLRKETQFFVIANDLENNISPKFVDSIQNYQIPVLKWSEKTKWIDQFKTS